MKHMPVLPQRPLLAAVNAALVAGLCALAAHWTWRLVAPEGVSLLPEARVESQRHEAADIAARHLFGSGGVREAALPPGLRLRGIFAPGKESPGAAIFWSQQTGSLVVAPGGQVSPGFYLDAILKDRVVLRHDGERVELRIEQIGPELDLSANMIISPLYFGVEAS